MHTHLTAANILQLANRIETTLLHFTDCHSSYEPKYLAALCVLCHTVSTLTNALDNLIQLMKNVDNDEFQLSEDLHSQALALKLINSNGAMENEVKLVLAHQSIQCGVPLGGRNDGSLIRYMQN